ncbi:amidohydrolase [Rhodococcus sp. HNM0563]|uniref:M20 metallopeptidase family protein n=1 Tax=Rhodococcus sp. HNM0563 TaxID=2716339 RepID=UPI00146F8FD9|nr:M20 family metallopeptidase [Rhodococcus sp. HNM0563]NLU64300.1 amidohydrolase [Rhodococcus sp. HNM0563]
MSHDLDYAPASIPGIPDYPAEATALSDDLIALRRAIHADPEIGLHTTRTQRRVLDALSGLDLEITVGRDLASVVAVLHGAHAGPSVILRGDMDALPIEEKTGLEFAATNGTMHACGHDLHTVGLVGAARLLAAHRDELHGSIIFMFQPGEEGHGGAKIMLDEGLLDAAGDRPVAAYAIHVAPGPRGVFITRPGPACAGSGDLTITVHGRGGHGSQPHLALDPVPIAAEIVLALQSFATRRFDAFDPVIISVTQLDTGDGAINVIPEQARLRATVRALTPTSVDRLQEGVPQLADGIARAHGARADVELEFTYPPTVNDHATTSAALDCLRDVFGEERVLTSPVPMMGSEDFSFVLDQVPGTFLALFATPADVDLTTAEFNHSPRAVFDDTVLADQAAALATLAHARLERARR